MLDGTWMALRHASVIIRYRTKSLSRWSLMRLAITYAIFCIGAIDNTRLCWRRLFPSGHSVSDGVRTMFCGFYIPYVKFSLFQYFFCCHDR